jgi:hypothetical protein
MNCAYCHTTRFGLARYQLLTLKGYVYFDRKRCRDDYLKANALQGQAGQHAAAAKTEQGGAPPAINLKEASPT